MSDSTTLDLAWLWEVLEARRRADPEGSYTAGLLEAGPDRIARKIGEEAAETIVAGMRVHHGAASREELVAESADLVYHLLVFLLANGVDLAQVMAELERRHHER